MQEIIAQLVPYVWGVWRHRWLALLVAWAVAVSGWMYVYKMPESYVARAKIYVDTNSVLRPLLRGLAITPNIDQRVRLMSNTLFSRPNLEKLARMTDLDLTVSTEAQQDALVNKLRRTVSLNGQRGNASMYNVTVRHEDREVARRITQSMITVFIESSLNEKRDDSAGAQNFIDKQIAEYEQRLIEAEARLARFKQENVDVLPGKGGDYYSRLENVRAELQGARLQFDEMTNRRDELERQFAEKGGEGLVGFLTPTERRIQQLQERMDALLMRYTERHPEIRQIRGLIEELETQQSTELNQIRTAGGDGSGARNPLYSQMGGMLAEAKASVAELTVRVEEFERREASLKEKVNRIPEIEVQLKQLDRDYNVLKRQHELLLQRRESARLSQGVEDNAEDVTFRVIDPPFVPRNPSEPNKQLLNTMVLFAALGAGGAVALLLALLRPIVVDARLLAESTGLPLLGVVTFNKDRQRKRRDLLLYGAFAFGVVMLLGAYGGALIAPQLVANLGAVI